MPDGAFSSESEEEGEAPQLADEETVAERRRRERIKCRWKCCVSVSTSGCIVSSFAGMLPGRTEQQQWGSERRWWATEVSGRPRKTFAREENWLRSSVRRA